MDSMKLVRIAAQPDQLYNLATEPREISDLAPADSKSTARMAGVLYTWFKVVVPLEAPSLMVCASVLVPEFEPGNVRVAFPLPDRVSYSTYLALYSTSGRRNLPLSGPAQPPARRR